MPDIELAKRADEVLKTKGSNHRVKYGYMSRSSIFDEVTGKVIYVGSGRELSSLFLFPNASGFIHQDLGDPQAPEALTILQEAGLISDLEIKIDEDSRGLSEFTYKNKARFLLEVHGPPMERLNEGKYLGTYGGETVDNPGNIGFVIPDEVKTDLQAIYFFAMPYPQSIRMIQTNLLPYLQIDGVFEGPYPYKGGRYEGAEPSRLGLKSKSGTYVKERHLDKNEIEQIIGYSAEVYAKEITLRNRYAQ